MQQHRNASYDERNSRTIGDSTMMASRKRSTIIEPVSSASTLQHGSSKRGTNFTTEINQNLGKAKKKPIVKSTKQMFDDFQ